MSGELGILNVGAGDTKLIFDPSKPEDIERACAIVKDMLQRGYAIFVEAGKDDKGPLYRRAEEFDATTAEYIIFGLPEGSIQYGTPEQPAKPGKQQRYRVPASSTNAVAVSRSAGG